MDSLDRQVSELEEELESIVVSFSDKHCELKHIVSFGVTQFGKIGKELSYDYLETDRAIREET